MVQAIRGHILRTHPETIPEAQFDRLLSDVAAMADLRERASEEPELWKTLFDFIAKRERGEKPSVVENKTKTIEETVRRMRTKAIETSGDLVRWYDGAWEFLLSYDAPTAMWVFSAMLFPKGRGSIAGDWRDLGAWTSAAGVPIGQREIEESIDRDPSAVHKWVWREETAKRRAAGIEE